LARWWRPSFTLTAACVICEQSHGPQAKARSTRKIPIALATSALSVHHLADLKEGRSRPSWFRFGVPLDRTSFGQAALPG
jgi:hypothetical protein